MTEDDDDTTSNTQIRWTYTATLLSILILLSLPALVIGAAAGSHNLSEVPQGWFVLYMTVCIMAATWVFGRKALEAAKDYASK